jgi:hypothetical protein
MIPSLQTRVLERWSALACMVLAAVLWVGPWLLRADLFYDDAAHHVFWLYQYADPALFPGDVTVAYFKTSATWAYRALYFVLAPLLDAQVAAESVSIVLLLACCLLVWRTALLSAVPEPEATGLLAIVALVVMLPLSQQKDVLPPIAFQRTFSLPLLLLTCWALVSRRYAWVGISWLAAALVYPVVLPVQGLAAAVVFLRDLIVERKLPASWITNALLGAAALAIAVVGIPIPPEVGPAYTYRQAMRMPEFGPHGRLRMYDDGPLGYGYWLGGHRAGFGWPPKTMLLLVMAAGAAALLGRLRSIPLAAWAMAGAGLGIFIAMRIFPEQLMFGLYLPNRHPKWALAVFAVFLLAVAASAALEAARRRWLLRFPERDWSMRRVVAFAAPMLVVAALLPTALEVWNRPVDRDLERAYAFISRLPKDTLVAAYPDLGDYVPLRTRRSVLTSTEISMAWMKAYYAQMKPRVEASLKAAFATRIEDVDAALLPFGVHVMLTGPQVWKAGEYFAPYDALSRELIARGAAQGFVLQAPPADRILFQSGQYYVVRVGTCDPRHCPR